MRTSVGILLVCLFAATAWGYSAKGMIAYKKLCKTCHGSGFKGAAMATSEEWEEYFADNAVSLRKVHEEDPEALEVIDSDYFKRRSKYLGPFLINNGSDTGAVRSCDGMNCG